MPAPTLKVEIAFLQSDGSYVWSDVSSYVRSADIERGVSRETDKYSAGQASVVLSNQLRYFDPTYNDIASTRTNLAKNPSFESNTTGWGFRNGTLATSVLDFYSGSSCCLFTVGSSATSAGIIMTGLTNFSPVTAGLTYTSSIFIKDVNTGKAYRAYMDFYNSAGTNIGGTLTGATTITANSTWQQVSVTGVAPASAAYARGYFYSTTSFLAGDAGKQVKFDGALFEQSGSAGTYFDGNTIRAGYLCSWVGTTNNSSSTASLYTSPFYGQVSPTGAIKITSNSTVIFYGSIDSWNFDFADGGFDGTATVNAFDSLSELAKRYLYENFPVLQTTGERIAYTLDRPEISWNSSLQDIDNGVNEVLDLPIAEGTNALSYIQEVADAEMGDVFCSRDGKIAFRDRRFLDYNWSSPTYRYNLCTCPSFESGKNSSYTVGTVSTLQKKYGSKSLVSTYIAGDGVCEIIYGDLNLYKWNTQGTGNYTVSMWVYPPSTSLNMTVWTTLSGTTIDTSSAVKAVVASTWQRISMTLNTTGVFDKFNFYLDNVSGSAVFYMDGVLIEKTASLLDYFDGTVIPTPDSTTRYTSAWDSTVNLSTSSFSTQTLSVSPSPITLNLSDYSGSDIPVTNVSTIYASENLFNRVVLTQSGTSSYQLAEDTTLQAIYGIRTYSADGLLNSTDPPILANANEMLTTYSKPEFRANEVELQLHGLSTANQNSVLAADLRDTIKLTFKPARTGSQMIKTYAIIGINHKIADASHTMIYRIASLQNTPFRLDSITTGVLDTNVIGYPNTIA